MEINNKIDGVELPVVAVVIPSYKVVRHIAGVIARIPDMVCKIYVVDDACPEGSGEFVTNQISDSRVKVLYHEQNLGVGGAVLTGYKAAIKDGADVIVKLDGDGQMEPCLIPKFVEPILNGYADYTKGNRFYNIENAFSMPRMRLFGNIILSFMTKLSSGYWNLFDPTNGYTAIHSDIAEELPFDKLHNRYFFESDMLFRLNTLRAVVTDIPMTAKYGEEESSLKISKIIGLFLVKHLINTIKRVCYNYYLRDLSLASIELPIGIFLFLFGGVLGGYNWLESYQFGIVQTPGTVMLAALPLLMGLQLILAFVGFDIASVPVRPIHSRKLRKIVDDIQKDN